jgi:hypothetical protein
MNQEVLAYLPLVAPVATLVIVMLGVFFQNRHIDIRIADVTKLISAESARLEAVLKLDLLRVETSLKTELAKLDFRVKTLEDRASLIYRS